VATQAIAGAFLAGRVPVFFHPIVNKTVATRRVGETFLTKVRSQEWIFRILSNPRPDVGVFGRILIFIVMQKVFFCLLLGWLAAPIFAQSGDSTALQPSVRGFNHLIISPYVELELQPGDTEAVRVEYSGVPASEVRIVQNGRTLHIYLREAKLWPRYRRGEEPWEGRNEVYRQARVKAYVTYKTLRKLELRGEQRVKLDEKLTGDRFTLRLYGETRVTLASIETKHLKVKLFGENQLRIVQGRADFQKYKVYGENEVQVKDLMGGRIKTALFGENNLFLNASERISVMSFGESEIEYVGEAELNRSLVFGRNRIRRQ
jgi:Putative auto-transporter adhesin, head GIN domain